GLAGIPFRKRVRDLAAPACRQHRTDGTAQPSRPARHGQRRGCLREHRQHGYRWPPCGIVDGSGSGGVVTATARPRSAGAVRHRRLETRGDRRGAGHGHRQFQGTTASRAKTPARATGGTRMNTHEHDDTLSDPQRWQLRALRQDHEPGRDLWDGIASRIAATPQRTAAPPAFRGRRHRGLTWFAAAATLALAVGLGWQLRPEGPVDAATQPPTLLSLEAENM